MWRKWSFRSWPRNLYEFLRMPRWNNIWSRTMSRRHLVWSFQSTMHLGRVCSGTFHGIYHQILLFEIQCGKKFNTDLASPRQFNKIYTACVWQCQLENDLAINVDSNTLLNDEIYPFWSSKPQSIATAFNCYTKCKDTINDLDPTCPEDGKYRTPNTCSSFYFCSNGIRFPNIECPYGLHFNGTDCDWPSEVDCPLIETNPVKECFSELWTICHTHIILKKNI